MAAWPRRRRKHAGCSQSDGSGDRILRWRAHRTVCRCHVGTVDRQDVYRLLVALAEHDGGQLLQIIAKAAEFSTNFDGLLDEVLAVLHRVAIAHAVPDSIDNQLGDEAVLRSLTELFDPEHVQLLYQIGLIGKRDLPLSPSPQIGFEMVMLRMLAFQPETGPTDEHRAPADRGDAGYAPASAPSESPLANLKASLASGAKGASTLTTGVSTPRESDGLGDGCCKSRSPYGRRYNACQSRCHDG